ncbi:MAG TPA: hypothetical protein ENN68_07995 [Methanomicrobia archaeon]|nr:hypothetical protein [Methanomicrobia archaeon]
MIAEIITANYEGEEELEEDDEAIVEETEYGGDEKTKEMTSIMERLKTREKKERAADLVSRLKGKKKANKKILPYEIYATSGE